MNKQRILFWFSLFAVHCLLVTDVFAGPGRTGAQFLKINPSARAAGMAGVFAGLADDAFAMYSNPAGLAKLEKTELAATYMRYFADINYGFIGYASQVKDIGVFGFGYTYLSVTDIDKRGLTDTKLGSFNARDTSLAVSFGKKDVFPALIEHMSVGASLKVINSEIDTTIAYTAALDLAAAYSPVEKLNTCLVLQNISPGIKFKEVTDPLPLNLRLGVSYQVLENLNIGTEFDEYFIDNKYYAAVGAEYWPIKQLALRGGYRFGYHTESLGSIAGLGLGMGFRIWSIGLDYAFVPYGDLGDTHRLSFSAKF